MPTKGHTVLQRDSTPSLVLYTLLCQEAARAVFQLYPENSEQLELITTQAMKAGFSGGMVVDYPNSSKAKKFFLCLFAGASWSPSQRIRNRNFRQSCFQPGPVFRTKMPVQEHEGEISEERTRLDL
ncbi:putative 18S rRNA (guanine-N(7))-methyltransferase [Larimichthys crocea]|uniref:Uncharacterized protein n=1 Tax=Larimichthys crocea TaxID=215358 RepID=A0ACD3QLA3_LARCR|nr:putative 18S rRNA (guanine-N(7))-methyltransferase [Larimichthys crocea]